MSATTKTWFWILINFFRVNAILQKKAKNWRLPNEVINNSFIELFYVKRACKRNFNNSNLLKSYGVNYESLNYQNKK